MISLTNRLRNRLTEYDVVIGNPPWQSQLTQAAKKYLKQNDYIVGDKQIAQAFSDQVCNYLQGKRIGMLTYAK